MECYSALTHCWSILGHLQFVRGYCASSCVVCTRVFDISHVSVSERGRSAASLSHISGRLSCIRQEREDTPSLYLLTLGMIHAFVLYCLPKCTRVRACMRSLRVGRCEPFQIHHYLATKPKRCGLQFFILI